MWTKAILMLTFLAVVVPLALLLGYHLGTGWVQDVILP
jgi:hypothetical protein